MDHSSQTAHQTKRDSIWLLPFNLWHLLQSLNCSERGKLWAQRSKPSVWPRKLNICLSRWNFQERLAQSIYTLCQTKWWLVKPKGSTVMTVAAIFKGILKLQHTLNKFIALFPLWSCCFLNIKRGIVRHSKPKITNWGKYIYFRGYITLKVTCLLRISVKVLTVGWDCSMDLSSAQ